MYIWAKLTKLQALIDKYLTVILTQDLERVFPLTAFL